MAAEGGGGAPPAPEDVLDESAYLCAVRRLISEGSSEGSERTGVGTLKLPGIQLRFRLTDRAGRPTVPALTCRRLFIRGVAEELLWFVRGSVDARELSERGVRIWEANTTPEFIAGRKLTGAVEPGHIGPGYGWQWRRGGAPWGSDAPGRDQLAEAFAGLRADPASRRHVVSCWDVAQLDAMVLPPCHYSFQFVASGATAAGAGGEDARRSATCVVTMRSGDFGLGIPFNAVSYAMLTHLAAAYAGMDPGEVVINVADAHVYKNPVGVLAADAADPLRPRGGPPHVALGGDVLAALAARLKEDEAAVDHAGRVRAAAAFLDDVGRVPAKNAFVVTGYTAGPRVKMEMAV